ncbi:DNA polymerase III subunit chi [Nisaea sediminum]|uniref:DNA polymerase III subunit chi n=1 Tax=Nisaea sediminum TaxID=2775867 RepID=UPI0018671971|nr:DNA polymerase III subunit chi [Nisaea sediminum]
MTDINFYHLTARPLEWALPKLLEKSLQAEARVVVMASSEERVADLNAHLWSYDPDSWLPHGSEKDGHAEDQPVWLTVEDENPNGARFLFLTDGATSGHIGDFERVFELFDGRNNEAVAAARARWKNYKDSGHTLAYWRQTDAGGWEKAG